MAARAPLTPTSSSRPVHRSPRPGIRAFDTKDTPPTFFADLMGAWSTWVDAPGPVSVAHDDAPSSEQIARDCVHALQRNGIDIVDLGVMPTPCFRFTTRALGARAGLRVLSSRESALIHELELTGPDGAENPPEAERTIAEAFARRGNRLGATERLGAIRLHSGGVERYLDAIAERVDRTAIRAAAPRLVLDCGCGPSAVVGPPLLRDLLGSRLTALNDDPELGPCREPPSPPEVSLRALGETVRRTGADLGIAYEGDSDRVAFVDERGESVPAEAALAVFARDVLRRRPGGTVVTDVTCSTALEEVVEHAGGHLLVTRSGPRAIVEGLALSQGVLGGGEEGCYYWPEHQNAPDGTMSSARLVDLLVAEARPFSEIVAELPSRVILRGEVPLVNGVEEAVMERLAARLARESDRTLTLEGVKAFYPDGWLLVRPSARGTLCRVVAEGRSKERAEGLLALGMQLVSDLVAALSEGPGPEGLWCDPS